MSEFDAIREELHYWPDDGGYVGRLMWIPEVFSQGETLEELLVNLRDAYELVMADAATEEPGVAP